MTESEAIEKLTSFKNDNNWGGSLPELFDMAISALEEIQQYQSLGTVEELTEAMEKQRAKKPKFYAQNFYCSKCGNLVGNKEFGWQRFMYCDHCGNAIDWSKEDD